MSERRLLQAVVAIACLIPLIIGGKSVLFGPAWLHGVGAPVPVDLDSQFRYVSGIFLALGIGFLSCVPRIEHRTSRFRLLGGMVVLGGLARAYAWIAMGAPSTGHRLGLMIELGVVPLLLLWQARIARIAAAPR